VPLAILTYYILEIRLFQDIILAGKIVLFCIISGAIWFILSVIIIVTRAFCIMIWRRIITGCDVQKSANPDVHSEIEVNIEI